jgi:acyl dehydratase
MSAVDGPWFEDLHRGQTFDTAPGLTLTSGHAALHQAIVGDRLRLALDVPFCTAVAGPGPLLAHPLLICDVAIGQSTLPTRRVVANLFYRGLRFHRLARIGDTLRTACEVVALRANRQRADRRATGIAVLRVRTTDQLGRTVLDFHRAAMLPCRGGCAASDRHDDLDAISERLPSATQLAEPATELDLAAFHASSPGIHWDDLAPGMRWAPEAGDVVTDAPLLARLTLNLATVHVDARAADRPRRLVYGGHTIGMAAAQLGRVLPNLVTVLAWHSCEHPRAVEEGDVLLTEVEVERLDPLPGGGGLAHLRCRVRARDEDGPALREVLDWRPVALMA